MSSIDVRLADYQSRGESVRALLSDLAGARLAPATLVVGAPGIGKKTLISLLAKAVLCTGDGEKPCGACRACRRFDARTHPDLLFPQLSPKDKTIKIDPIRTILKALSRHAFEGGKRVVLLENAERMTAQAQNCLLKSLEEADENTFFFLSADQETAVLPTIRSRCRIVRMPPLTDEQVKALLIKSGVSSEVAQETALLSEGSIGCALDLLSDAGEAEKRRLVADTFFAVREKSDIPMCSLRLKDTKDDADKLLDILEQRIRLLMREKAGIIEQGSAGEPDAFWRDAPLASLAAILNASLEARKMRASFVSWPAIADRLLETIAEEIIQWQR